MTDDSPISSNDQMLTAAVIAIALMQGQPKQVSPRRPSLQDLVRGLELSPDESIVYTIDSAGGMQAVRINDGQVLWHNAAARWPVAAFKDKVFAFSPRDKVHQLLLFQLDTRTGKEVSRSKPIELPEWCYQTFSFDRLLSTSFSMWVTSKSASKLDLRWFATTSVLFGIPPPEPLSPEFQARIHHGGGTIHINLEDGTLNSSRIDDEVLRPFVGYQSDGKTAYLLDRAVNAGTIRVLATKPVYGKEFKPASLYLEYVGSDKQTVWRNYLGGWFEEQPLM